MRFAVKTYNFVINYIVLNQFLYIESMWNFEIVPFTRVSTIALL